MNKLESRLANQSDSDSLFANEACDMNFYASQSTYVTGIVSRITFCPVKWVTAVSKLFNFWHLKFILWYTLSHEIITTDQPLTYN